MKGLYLQPEPLLQVPGYAAAMARTGMSVPTYAYALNNPLAVVDRDGKEPVTTFLILLGIGSELFRESLEDADEARRRTRRLPGSHSGMGDAMRHCIWSCEMTRDVGSGVAAGVSVAHEVGGMVRDWWNNEERDKETKMDSRNDACGREQGRKNEKKSCADSCYLATGNGELQTLPHNPW